jgi:hypothetical protein
VRGGANERTGGNGGAVSGGGQPLKQGILANDLFALVSSIGSPAAVEAREKQYLFYSVPFLECYLALHGLMA